jgi:phosphoglycolate phosphatase
VSLFANEVYMGTPELLAGPRGEGHELRVVTSKPTVYAERIATHFELDAHFARVHGSELSGLRTDKIELIAHVLDTEGLTRQDCVMIGDRSHDVPGARANDLRSVSVSWGFGSRDELDDAGADEIADDLAQLREVLDEMNGAAT